MKENIQLVIDTLQQLEIKATYENMNHLMGCLQMLATIRDEKPEQKGAEENVSGES